VVHLSGVTLAEAMESPPDPPRRPKLPSRVIVRDGHFRYPGVWWGLYKLNPVVTRSLKAPGLNPLSL
jgi:hypothetical protein